MNYGPFQSYTIAPTEDPKVNLVAKGIAIHLGENDEAAICFDTDLLRYSAGWTGKFLDLSKTHLTSSKGSLHATIAGDLRFSTKPGPGWGVSGNLEDPRAMPAGPLPATWGKYRGLYRHGRRVVLAYTVDGVEVHETPSFVRQGDGAIFLRDFTIGPTPHALTLLVCDAEGLPVGPVTNKNGAVEMQTGGVTTRATIVSVGDPPLGPEHPKLTGSASGRLQVQIPPHREPRTFRLQLFVGSRSGEGTSITAVTTNVVDPKTFCLGGPALWPEALATSGRLANDSAAYVVDTVIVPETNPWNSWMRLVALDFFSDGRAAVSTWNGDVWLVSGLDRTLRKVTWKRFAAGLFEGLGLKIVGDQIYLVERSQLTRLHDLNGDGEADFYENFNNDAPVGESYHAFAFGLDTDSRGNFYYTRCGQRVDPELPLNGGMIKVSADGRHSELFATGLRAPNGMSIGPGDKITCSDNQGNWVPASRIDIVRQGGFYGYVPHARITPPPTRYDGPICWLPHLIDNSSGGQVWVPRDGWGPLQGQLLHTSYGKGTLFHVMTEEVNHKLQGGVFQLPLKFESGIMRGRFHPKDGQLYVVGLRGWQAAMPRDGALQRVRYTGQPLRIPLELHTRNEGLELRFSAELDPGLARDEQNYAVERWNYRWSEEYGSPEFSVSDPGTKGRDVVDVVGVELLEDKRTVLLRLAEKIPAMQMRVRYRIKTTDGMPCEGEIYNTVHNWRQD